MVRMILNKKISNHALSDAYSKILDSNLMPLKKEIYSKNQYDSFLSQRANILLQYFDQVTEK
jgi:hypothetical protein